jgi:hypothetical protein
MTLYSGGGAIPDTKTLNNVHSSDHMSTITRAHLSKLPTIEVAKRIRGLEATLPLFEQMNKDLLAYDETYVAPFVVFHMLTTLNNLTMLDPRIVYTPSEIGYNDDMSQAWAIYEDRESGLWVRVDMFGTDYSMTLSTSTNSWTNVTWTDIMDTLATFVETGTPPTSLGLSPTAPAAERPGL